MKTQIELVDIGSIKPDPNQPRTPKSIVDEEIAELASTYETQGMIHVIEVDENNIIILGERRWRAAKKIGLKEVRIIRKTGLDKLTRLERQLIDDANRKDLTDKERAWGYATAIININQEAKDEDKRYTILEVRENPQILNSVFETRRGRGQDDMGSSELSRRIGVPQQTIHGIIQIIKLSDDLQKKIGKGEKEIPYTTAIEVVRLKDKQVREQLSRTLIDDARKDISDKTFKSRKEIRNVVSLINKPSEKIVEKDVLDIFTRSDLEGSEREEAQKRIEEVIEPKVKLTKGEKDDLITGRKKPERLIHQKKEELIDDAVTDLIEQVPEDILTEKEQEMREHATKSRKEREESNRRLRASILAQLKRKFFYSSGAHGAATSGIDKMFCPKCGEDSSNLR